MPISPKPDEDESTFMSRCIAQERASDIPQDQAVAICSQAWRDKEKAMSKTVTKQPEPDEDESREDFMDRCLEETGGDQEACELAWEDRSGPAIIAKTHTGEVNGLEFVLSDDSVDRMGDIVSSSGWDIKNFQKNPVALGFHNPSFVVGTWKNLRVDGNELRGHLKLAPEGTSPRIDEVRKLVEAGILKAVSVGFRPIKREPLDKDQPHKGIRFIEQELVETSLVSVPANPNSLAVAKSLNVSADTLTMVFAGQGARKSGQTARRSTGGQADTPPMRSQTMSALSQNIQDTQGRINVLTDALKAHHEHQDNDNVTDADIEKTNDLNQRLTFERKKLTSYLETEKNIGSGDDAHTIRMPTHRIPPPDKGNGSTALRVYPEVAKQYKPGDLMFKALTCMVRMQNDKYRKSNSLEVIRDTYGEDDKVRTMFDFVIGKAATVPALTTGTGWADTLVRTDYQGFLEALQPASVAARLLPKGLTFTFGTNGIISIPMRQATPTIAGSFVGEGAPIPVRQGAFTAITLIPKKMAVITVFSREISEHSTPAIEGLLRSMIIDDTAAALDAVLLDGTAASAVRPAGIRYDQILAAPITTLTPTAGGGFAAVVGDVKLIVAAMLTATLGNIRSPVWLMPPGLVLALRLTVAPNGTFAFPEVASGSFAGWPIIESPNVTTDTLYLIDAADFMSASGDPRFDVSDAATVHMEDTTPLAIGTVGTPASVAAPTRSFWQTDTLGIRMIMPMNWAFRRSGMIKYITNPSWK